MQTTAASPRLGGTWTHTLIAASPALLYAVRLWASVCLALFVAFWLELDNPYWAGTSAAAVCQPQLGASLRKGWFRMIGTVAGAVVIVLLTACFPQDRIGFLVLLALWCGLCAFGATVLRNFASYAAALAGFTAAIIAANTLGATGGPTPDVFMLAIRRTSEICIGIVSAGIVLAGTDLGASSGGWPTHSPIWQPGSRVDLPACWPSPGRPCRTRNRSGASSSVALSHSNRMSTRRSANPATYATTRRRCRVRSTASCGRLMAGAPSPPTWAANRRRWIGRGRKPSCAAFRQRCDRRRNRARRRVGSPIPWHSAPIARKRCAGCSRCRLVRHRYGYSPTNAPRCWTAFCKCSTDWRYSPAHAAGRFRTIAVSSSRSPIGCRHWPTVDARSSRSERWSCSGSQRRGRTAPSPSSLLPSWRFCFPRKATSPSPARSQSQSLPRAASSVLQSSNLPYCRRSRPSRRFASPSVFFSYRSDLRRLEAGTLRHWPYSPPWESTSCLSWRPPTR